MKLQDVKDMNKDDLLGLLGLQTKRSVASQLLGSLGTFGIGLLVGAGVALLLAPKAGRELREELRARIQPDSHASADDGTAQAPGGD